MKLKRSIFLFCSIAFIGMVAFTGREEDPIEKLLASLQSWAENNPQEKAYLHTDKPYYIVGDTIWFKTYVTIGSKHQLSALSGAVYVELINEGDSIAQSLKLPLMAGMAKGSIVLSDTAIREGNYRLRAYTQWMRNAGPEYFYDRTFSVGNSAANTVFAKIDYIYTQDEANAKVSALLKYTNQKGEPYVGKPIRYELRKSFQILATGGGNTNELGEISVNIPGSKPGEVLNSYLLTKIAIAKDANIFKSFPIRTASLKTDVQFFPEGGGLVNGVRSRIGFKATGANGLGVPIKGVIMDNENNEVVELESKHLGMGYFQLIPEKGKSYQAKITYPDGSVNTLKLPDALDDGYVLSVYNNLETDIILVRVNAGGSALKKEGQIVSLVVQCGGDVQYAASIAINKSTTSIPIPAKDFPTGILQISLFSKEGNPLNERIVFLQRNDLMDLKINSSKKEYDVREKVELDLDAKDALGKPLVGNFSVSVINEAVVPSDETRENSIISQLLLSSDIKGYIEKPNYYFYKPTVETKANLDILMLTQGYRRFVWKNLILGKQVPPIFKAEKLVTDITGKLVTLGNKPVIGGKVTLVNNKLGLILDTVSDKNGLFKFSNLLITEGIDFTIQGRTLKNGKRLELQLDKVKEHEATPNANIGDINTNIPSVLKASIENNIEQDLDLRKHGKASRLQQLREVQISASKRWEFGNHINESQADEVYRPDSRRPCATLKECLEEMDKTRISFVFKDGNWLLNGYYVTLIDDVLIEPEDYQSLLLSDVSDIKKIYFSYNSKVITARLLSGYIARFPPEKLPSVMAIYTKSGNFRQKYDPSVVYYAPKGFASVKEFYVPKYGNNEVNNSLADLRSTIYWNPATVTDKEGKARLSYFNSDNKGTYRVTVEGINADGLLGRQVYRYQVK